MKDDNGVILPLPRKESGVNFKELSGPALGFNISVFQDEYITVTQAAKMLGITKEQMQDMVESKNLEKHDANKDRYLLSLNDIEMIKYNAL